MMKTNSTHINQSSSSQSSEENRNVKKIKFPTQVQPDFIHELRERVNDYFTANGLSKYGNMSIVAKSIVMLALYFGPLAFMIILGSSSIPLTLVLWMIMGAGMAGVGMVLMHDANHGTFSKNRQINNWKHQHNTLHHGFTNVDGHDEDIAPLGILRFSPHRPLYKIHRYQHLYAWFFYGLMTISWSTVKDFRQLHRFKKQGANLGSNKTYPRMYVDIIVGKIVYYLLFLVIPLAVLPLPWYVIVLSFLLMHFVCGLILGLVFQTAHVVTSSAYPLPDESGNMENNWAIHQLYTTSDYAPGSKILSWMIGGLNYQVEHHLFPNISHVHYKSLSVLVKSMTEKHQLPYHVQPSFIAALDNHRKMLKVLGSTRNPGF
jgi:linoleoyl-CoA desaturase